MQIFLKNEIQLDHELEVVEQTFPVEVTEKNGCLYLLYTNDEHEKVIMKVTEDELVMTRFSTPKTIMRFIKEAEAIVVLHTPMGVQHFKTDTSLYLFNPEEQTLKLQYQLKTLEGEGVFASYKMMISWL